MTYEYRPLVDAGTEIRLAVLGPGTFNDQINITFKIQPLHVRHSHFSILGNLKQHAMPTNTKRHSTD